MSTGYKVRMTPKANSALLKTNIDYMASILVPMEHLDPLRDLIKSLKNRGVLHAEDAEYLFKAHGL